MEEKKSQEIIVLSVGGSLLVPNEGNIDVNFLSALNLFIRKHIKKGRKFFIVVGGGKTARNYRDAVKSVVGEITHDDLDWLGIHTTRLNAHLLRTMFQDIAHPRIIENYDKKLTDWKEKVVIGAGWKPGHSTDYDAVLLAKDYKASVIINMTNIDWIYDKDPRQNPDAAPIKKTTWDYYQKIVGTTWLPGINAPFDPVASQLAKKLKLTVIIANGTNFSNLDNILNGENFDGTVIAPLDIDASFYDREYYEGKKGEYRLACTESYFGSFLQYVVNWYRALWIKYTLNPTTCLDIGCGTGKLVECLRRLGVDARGIEISDYALSVAKKSVAPYLGHGDITNIPFKENSFDVVVSFDVLEHLERSKLQNAVKESIRVARSLVMHKVYTRENHWIHIFHGKDISHVSVMSREYWIKMFKYMKQVTLINPKIALPSFFETIFLLKKT